MCKSENYYYTRDVLSIHYQLIHYLVKAHENDFREEVVKASNVVDNSHDSNHIEVNFGVEDLAQKSNADDGTDTILG